MSYLIVFLGAGIGGSLRHGVNVIAPRLFGTALPFGTMFVNIAGSLTMGLIVGYFAFRGEAAQMQRLFLTTGILGGFTTFSPSRSTFRFSSSAAILPAPPSMAVCQWRVPYWRYSSGSGLRERSSELRAVC